jgi:deferrochelatase/peroxidase EfeB
VQHQMIIPFTRRDITLSCTPGGVLALFLVLVVLCMLSGCAKTPLERATTLRDAGKLEEAVALHSQAIDDPRDDSELLQHLHFRAQTLERMGRWTEAFADYYAAWIVSCSLADEQFSGRSYVSGMVPSRYCRDIGPRRMEETGARLGTEQKEAARRQALQQLPGRFATP